MGETFSTEIGVDVTVICIAISYQREKLYITQMCFCAVEVLPRLRQMDQSHACVGR